MFFRFDDFKSKFFIEFYGTVIIQLNVSKNKEKTLGILHFEFEYINGKLHGNYLQVNAIKISIFLNIIQNVLNHHSADTKTSVWI